MLTWKPADKDPDVKDVYVRIMATCVGTGERCDKENELRGCGRNFLVESSGISICECGLIYRMNLYATLLVEDGNKNQAMTAQAVAENTAK